MSCWRSARRRRTALASALEPLETRTLLAGAPPEVLGIESDAGVPAGVEVGHVKFLVVHFSADVGGSLTLADVHVRNITTHTDVVPASLTWDPASTSAVIQFATPTLPDGNYTLTISATAVSNGAGNPLAGNNPDGDYTAWFSEMAGDANGDRVVNFTDLLALARNYNGAGEATLAQGDFNSDRRVTFDDLLTLARNYNNALARSVRLVGPAEGAQVTGTVNFIADPSDVTGLAGVRFLVNGSPVGAEVTTAPYSFSWDSTSVTNGSYQVTTVARGSNGSTTTSEPIDIAVNNPDVTPPSVSLSDPADDATVNGTVSVAVDASDNVGVVGVQFLVDGVVVGAEDTAAPYSFSWDSKTVGDGPHTLAARARDAAGNLSTSPARWVTVANTNAGTQGQWSSVMDWPLVAINSILLKDDRFLMWDGDGTGTVCIGPTSARVWDPATGQFTPVPIPDFTGHEDDIFCSGNATLADGRVLVVGGHDCDGPGLGVKATHLFDPRTMTWTRGPDLNYARWYPTATTLADGRVLVLGGSNMTTVDYVSTPEIYDPVTNTFTELDNADLAIPSYSFVFQHPDGRVIVAGSDESKMPTYALDVATQTWSVVDPSVLDAGSGVMYQPGKFMKAGSSYLSAPADNGGATPSKATTYILDTTQPTPHWVQTASMAYARTHLNLTILPDGSVLTTGGSSDIGGLTPANGVLPAELWSPGTQTWTTMSSMATPRMYHSTANLMPDGRVLITGGGRLGPVSFPSAEIYSPAYLFKGPRPVVTSAPASVEYGSDFFVATPDGARIASVAMIRTGATTHSFNMDQRFVPLTYTVVAGGLMVHAPSDSRVATPGHYMLFLVDTKGVPAVAPIIKLPAAYEDEVPPTAPTNVDASGAVGAASLTWTAATDNIGIAKYNVYRSTISGFVPGPQNLVGSSTSASLTDHPAAGTYYYVVRAVDLAGNIGPASVEVSATVLADTTPPAVGIDGPTQGSTVTGVATVTATASDDVSVAGVKFYVDGVQVGAEDVAAPYSFDWDSRSLSNGTHTLTAVARDAAGNFTTSAAVTVTIANSNGLVAAYSFNEGSGLTAGDATGHGLNGSLSGGVAWTASGKFGGALSFDGINDIVNIADADALDLTTGMTLEAWVRPTSLTGYRTVILKDVPGELSYSLYASGDVNRPSAWARVGGTSHDATGSLSLPLNTWSFLAATYDGTTLRLFVNGAEVANRVIGGAIETSNNPLQIGGNAIWGEYFAGLIDNVRIYNRALTVAQIQTDMNAPVVNGAAGAMVEAELAAASVAAMSTPTTTMTREVVGPKKGRARPVASVFSASRPIERTRRVAKRVLNPVLGE